jgi:Putative beta-barrel porin-2, OmpL-like. bbp2
VPCPSLGRRHAQRPVEVARHAIDLVGVRQDRLAQLDRGFFLSRTALQPIRTASAGWHFHAWHGINLEFGIFPSYVGMESYLPQENWNYTHPFLSDFTPYYFYGGRAQIYPSTKVKIEIWLVNGWQTFGQWHESRAGGYLAQWRPTDRLVLTNVVYAGREQPADSKALRLYTDNYAQLQYYRASEGVVTSSALGLVADVGYERRGSGAPSGAMAGFSLTHRTELWRRVALTLRGDFYYDKTRAITTQLPVGNPYALPRADDPFRGGGLTATLDYRPSPWLVWRLEYAHREANVPFFSGRRGITGDGPRGTPSDPAEASAFAPDLHTNDDRLVGNATLRL